MRWKGRRASTNVDDRRRSGGGKKAVGGGIGVLVIALVVYLMGGDPTTVIQQAGNMPTTTTQSNYKPSAAEDEAAEFVKVVLAETEQFWQKEFRKQGYGEYQLPTLVLYHQSTQSGCGQGTAASGPFYCPLDQSIYIDLDFYEELHRKFNAPGDFAMAYVVAHEVGHHVQTLLGISKKVRALKERRNRREANRLSVMQELQADFFAGLWAHDADRMQAILDRGDIEEALNAANSIGDDYIQRNLGNGRVVPESFTHGTSAQRIRWFKKGYTTGDINQGDTFGAKNL